jgi:hypothetical protein
MKYNFKEKTMERENDFDKLLKEEELGVILYEYKFSTFKMCMDEQIGNIVSQLEDFVAGQDDFTIDEALGMLVDALEEIL